MMKRVGDPQLAPDARRTAFTLRTTELAANKGHTALERIGADGGKSEAVSDLALSINNYKLSPDGRRSQLFLATLGSNGKLEGHLVWLTQELDGNIPSKHLR